MNAFKAQDSLENALADLVIARDDTRVRLHLLSMEARDVWSELDARIERAQHGITERAETVLHLRELARSVRLFLRTHGVSARPRASR